MDHPRPLRPTDLAHFDAEKMAKSTLFQSEYLLVGLNAFEPGQEHRLHVHAEMDKLYLVLSGEGGFLLDDREERMEEGMLLVAPAGVAHGIRNDSGQRLLVLVVLAPPPVHK